MFLLVARVEFGVMGLFVGNHAKEDFEQALALLDAVTRGQGPVGSSFHNADQLEALLVEAGPATAMTPKRKARIYGNLRG